MKSTNKNGKKHLMLFRRGINNRNRTYKKISKECNKN